MGHNTRFYKMIQFIANSISKPQLFFIAKLFPVMKTLPELESSEVRIIHFLSFYLKRVI